MILREIAEILDASVITGEELLGSEICSACGSDLMSDVLAFFKDRGILLTGLMNPQVIRTSEMMDIHAIVFVRGKSPDEDMIELAKEKEIALLTTRHPLYISCGLLYSSGLVGKEKAK